MDPKSEKKSLSRYPLPEEKIDNPLAVIWDCDTQIMQLEEQIKSLQDEKQRALEYAVKHGVLKEDTLILKESVKVTRKYEVVKK